jgi:hypothetical protein
MPAPQTVIQAAVSRLVARTGSGLMEAAAGAAVLLQDAPERLLQEWRLFVEEVELEAERLEHGGAAGPDPASPASAAQPPAGPVDLQAQIDALRARVATLSRQLDNRS